MEVKMRQGKRGYSLIRSFINGLDQHFYGPDNKFDKKELLDSLKDRLMDDSYVTARIKTDSAPLRTMIREHSYMFDTPDQAVTGYFKYNRWFDVYPGPVTGTGVTLINESNASGSVLLGVMPLDVAQSEGRNEHYRSRLHAVDSDTGWFRTEIEAPKDSPYVIVQHRKIDEVSIDVSITRIGGRPINVEVESFRQKENVFV